MSDRTVQFGRVPYGAIDSGAIRQMQGSDVKLYLALSAHVDRDFTCMISIKRLVKLTGLAESTVHESARRLNALGWVAVSIGGGRGRSNRYTLLSKPSGNERRVCDTETLRPDREKPPDFDPKTLRPEPLNPPTAAGPEQIEQSEQNNNSPVVVAKPNPSAMTHDRDVVDALTCAGIAEPTRSTLAAMPGITAKLVREVAQRTKAGGGRTGAVVRAIETAVQAEGAQQRDEQQRQQEATQREEDKRRKAEADHVERERLREEWAKVDQYIASLDDETLQREKESVLNTWDKPQRDFLAPRDPRKDRTLKSAIYKRSLEKKMEIIVVK